jgi:hypothetical protein
MLLTGLSHHRLNNMCLMLVTVCKIVSLLYVVTIKILYEYSLYPPILYTAVGCQLCPVEPDLR